MVEWSQRCRPDPDSWRIDVDTEEEMEQQVKEQEFRRWSSLLTEQLQADLHSIDPDKAAERRRRNMLAGTAGDVTPKWRGCAKRTSRRTHGGNPNGDEGRVWIERHQGNVNTMKEITLRGNPRQVLEK
jgi:hypothetical protein